MAAPQVQRLIGVWDLRLRSDAVDSKQAQEVLGQVALTLNEERLDGPGFGEPPMFFGSYNVDLRRIGLGASTDAGIPAVVGRLHEDTLELQLAPLSKLPVELTGVIASDSILGRWIAHQRAGADALGHFVLRRH